MRRLLPALLLAVALSCSRGEIDRAEWQRMSQQDRVLYVNSLIGGEKAKQAKGGSGRAYEHPAQHYVARIDEAYARGDSRHAHEIFEGLPE